jgi:hypothetical protein
MAFRYRSKYSRGYSRGSEFARRHIEEAAQFSREIGGTDRDVKEYFFKLNGTQLHNILDEYGRKYGSSAKSYAIKVFPRWKSGSTKMSGLVAKRLFNLLPPRMPISKKFELAENVWNHFGPSSSLSYTIGCNSDVEQLAFLVSNKLDETVTEYNIPEAIKNRFNWLSAGDVSVKEKLLNHFRQIQKGLAVEKARAEIPVLQRQMREHPDITGHAKSILKIYKHEVNIWVDKKLDQEIFERGPKNIINKSKSEPGCMIVIVGLIILWIIKSIYL